MVEQGLGEITELTSGLQFPEGPVALPDGSVVLVEIKTGVITRVQPDGRRETVAKTGGGPNGAAIGPDGRLYVCNNGGFEWSDLGGILLPGNQPADYTGGSIQRVDLASGAVETVYTECDGNPLRGPNDLVFDQAGGFWFSDLGKTRPRDRDRGGIYYALPDGSAIREVIYPLDSPNGVGLSPDGRRLYAAETHTGRVYYWDLEAPGVIAAESHQNRLLAGLPGLQLLDSMAIDSEGHVCVATLINGGITRISPDGARIQHFPMPDPLTTNLCFGGPDLRTAYVTLSGTGRLAKVRWPVPGLKLNY
jgi:gluconolactonase